MDRNLMPEIMKMLGVEYNEKFQVNTHGTEFAKGNLFCFQPCFCFLTCTAWRIFDK